MPKRTKRKITIDDRNFFWYVAEDFEDTAWLGAENTLTIFSEDSLFRVKYPISQKQGKNHLVVVGKEFVGDGKFGKTYQRVESPVWEKGNAITPGLVREIIEWSLSAKDCKFVDYQGRYIGEVKV